MKTSHFAKEAKDKTKIMFKTNNVNIFFVVLNTYTHEKKEKSKGFAGDSVIKNPPANAGDTG